MKKGIIILIVLFMGGVATKASADYLNQKFRDMDIDNDEMITWSEYKDYMPRPQMADFREADLNHDGKMELFEWITHQNNQDTCLAEKGYRYENQNGQTFQLKNGYWYKQQNGFWYQYRDRKWIFHSRVDSRWGRRCDWDWNPRWPHDNHYRYRYRVGFSYGVRFSDDCR